MIPKKIIIIDDDTAILDALNLVFDIEGFDVTTFERGTEIFEFLENHINPDIILLDMWLKNEDGRDICKKLKNAADTKNIPIIIMSASRGLEPSALDSGADAFIAKPFEFDDVVDQMNKFIKNNADF
ncbi:response regulator [Halpernia sp. GG3]